MSRVMCLDYGRKRIGVAMSDPGRVIASPLELYTRRDPAADSRHFRELAREERVGLLVVGLPVHTSGREGELAAEARAFGQRLSEAIGVPLVFRDERYSSVEAENLLRERGVKARQRTGLRDQLAAQIVLQAFLDDGCPIDQAPLQPIEDDPSEGH